MREMLLAILLSTYFVAIVVMAVLIFHGPIGSCK